MFTHDYIITRSRRFQYSHAFFAALLVLIPFASALAQGVGAGRELSDTGGNHVLTGRIYFPTQQTDDIRIKVRLESTSSPSLSTSTNADGVFRFSGLNTGYYTVVVDAGEQYEVFREQINIERGNSYSPRTVQIPIYLRPKSSGPGTKPGVVNAALLGLPKPAVDLYNKALESARAGNTKKAIEQLNSAIALYPNFALALNELGVQYLKNAQVDKAVEALRSAVKLAPDAFMPRLNYSIALVNKKDFAEAEKELRVALQKNDASRSAHMYLGIALISQRKIDDAEKELLRAASPGTDDLGLAHYYLGGIYWSKHEYKRAADELEKYLKLVPNAPDAERTRAAIKDLRTKQQ